MQSRARYIILGIIWTATLSALLLWFLSTRGERLAIAAGPRGSESFELASAIAEVFNEHNSLTRIDVFETAGSADNIRLLEKGQVDFATAQADIQIDETATAVASLYFDAYQLIANDSTGIKVFNELRGRRVAIPSEGSGQNDSFWFVANHYGLSPEDLTALPMSEDAANFAMVMGQVDAVFRVRAPGNERIRELVRDHDMHLVPIYHAEALALKRSALAPGVVPAGAYRGAPALPVYDLQTPILERVLVAHADVDDELINKITRLLFERHSELVALSPLAGFITPIEAGGKISMPVHPGAQRYYDREKPGFWQQNTRILASLLYVVAILSSVGIALRSRIMRAHKVRVSDYTLKLVDIAAKARDSDSTSLYVLRDQLVSMLQQVITDLSKDRVSQEEFEHFSFTWQAVDAVVRDRLAQVEGAG